jgi:hypothetical protein
MLRAQGLLLHLALLPPVRLAAAWAPFHVVCMVRKQVRLAGAVAAAWHS